MKGAKNNVISSAVNRAKHLISVPPHESRQRQTHYADFQGVASGCSGAKSCGKLEGVCKRLRVGSRYRRRSTSTPNPDRNSDPNTTRRLPHVRNGRLSSCQNQPKKQPKTRRSCAAHFVSSEKVCWDCGPRIRSVDGPRIRSVDGPQIRSVDGPRLQYIWPIVLLRQKT